MSLPPKSQVNNVPTYKTKYICEICGCDCGRKKALITHQETCSIALYNILDRLNKKLIPEDIFSHQHTNKYLRHQDNLNKINKSVLQLKDLNPYNMINFSTDHVIDDVINDVPNNDIYNNHHTLPLMPTKPSKPSKKQPTNRLSDINLKINILVKDINTEEEEVDTKSYNDKCNDYYSQETIIDVEEVSSFENVETSYEASNNDCNNDTIDYEPILDEYLTNQDKDNIKDIISNLCNTNTKDHYIKFKDKIYSSTYKYYEDLYIHIYYCDNIWIVDDTSSDSYITFMNKKKV